MLDNGAASFKALDPAAIRLPTAFDEVLLDQHPVLRAAPEPLRDAVRNHGRSRRRGPGESAMTGQAVGFLIRGSISMFDRRDLACVHQLDAGSTFGWEAALGHEPGERRMLALLESSWIEIPAAIPLETLGRGWLERVFAHHALDRLNGVQTLAACRAVHPVSQRVASLILRLAQIGGPSDVRTTQAAVAEAVGVQRTSVNAAIKALQAAEAVSVRRGRLRVLSPDLLRRFACGCV